MPWNGENIVQVRNTSDRQSLSAAENYFSRELTDGSRDKSNHDRADVIQDGIPSQDNYGPVADRIGQLSPPDLATLHASSDSHLETAGNSVTSCV